MVIPTVFIVGAPRCGTTSLAAYLAQHPQMFVSKPKEPHHFGSDLDIRKRPYADRQKYLELFHDAGSAQQAGEASVLYLYSKTAPGEIQALSPSAKIIIMLRDPVEMVSSLHAHNLMLGHEDISDLQQAVAAQAERRLGRRLSRGCLVPFALQYSALGKYAEHVRRYQEVFGADHVRCILFDDLKKDPERTYRETLAFLGLEPAALPEFKAHNERQRWRSPRAGRAMTTTFRFVQHACTYLPTKVLRKSVSLALGIPFHLLTKANLTSAPASPMSAGLRNELRETFREDVEQLAGVLDRDLSSWLQPSAESPAGGAPIATPLKYRWRVDQNYLARITAGQWRRLRRDVGYGVDAAYWHRALLITLLSVQNSFDSWRDERRYGAEIDKLVIEEPPLFILGHWRTGTTLLHNLLSRDPRFAYPNLYEVLHPGSFLSKGDVRGGWLASRLTPTRRAMDNVAFGLDLPQEDEFALALSCLRSPNLASNFPRTGAGFLRYLTFKGVPAHEVSEWKRTLLWFAKKLTLKYRRPLVFKSPPHTARIRLLLEVFPEARFVNIHRDPRAVFQSWLHTQDTAAWFMYLQRPPLARRADVALGVGKVLFDAYFEQRDLIPPGRLVDVAYEDLEARPVEVVQDIYARLDLPAFEEFQPRLQAYVDSLGAYRKNRFPELAPEVSEKLVRVWRRAFDEWGYSI